MATNKPSHELQLEKYLEQTLTSIAGKVFDDKLEEAIQEFESKRDEFLHKTVVKLRKWTRIEDHSNHIVITIQKGD